MSSGFDSCSVVLYVEGLYQVVPNTFKIGQDSYLMQQKN